MTMMRIDSEEALLKVSDILRAHNKPVGGMTSREACEDILEAVRPKGKWEYTTHYARRYRVCPICKAEKEDDCSAGWNFCHYCGARMEA